MNFDFYLAYRYVSRNKKRSLFMCLGIIIVLIMSIAISIVTSNLANQPIIDAKINSGNWHLGYIANKDIINQVKTNKYVESASILYHLETVKSTDNQTDIDIYLLDKSNFDIMVENVTLGKLPEKHREIIVPDWYVRKNNIVNFPVIIKTNIGEFKISGAYKTRSVSLMTGKLKAFISYQDNDDLINFDFLSATPLNNENIQPNENATKSNLNTCFVLIRLKQNCNLTDAEKSILEIQNIKEFNSNNYYLSDLQKTKETLYNNPLIIAQNLKGYGNNLSQYKESSFFTPQNLSLAINIILFIALFFMIFIIMNFAVNNDIKNLGIFIAIGSNSKQIKNLVLFQAFFITLISLPIGSIIGIFATYRFLNISFGKLNGFVVMPTSTICLSIVLCFIAITFATLFPAIKASFISPINAINYVQGVRTTSNITKIKSPLLKGKILLSFSLGIKNIFKSKLRFLGIVVSLILLLSIFIRIATQIEIDWKKGNGRQSSISDYTIQIPYINDNYQLDKNIQNPTSDFINKLKSEKEIKEIYLHYSIINNIDTHEKYPENYYNYFFRISKDLFTPQAIFNVNLSSPSNKDGYPNDCFISAGLSGYDDNGLEFAKKYLIEGSIDVSKMKTSSIILLPKYLSNYQNINIPYSKLKVGDKIKLIADVSNDFTQINIKKEFEFIIGGFLDNLPFKQINGLSTGFNAIMHYEQLSKINPNYFKLQEIYINENNNDQKLKLNLMQITKLNNYDLIDNKDNYIYKELLSENKISEFTIYSIFIVLEIIIMLTIFNLILSTISMRKKEFSMLNAIGMSKKQIISTIFTEVFFSILIGTLLGSITGILILLLGNNNEFSIDQLIPYTHIKIAVLSILIITFISFIIGIYSTLRQLSISHIKE